MKRDFYLSGREKIWLDEQWAVNESLAALIESISWRQNQIQIFGKWHNEPRLTAWFGPAYSYSGINHTECEIPPFLTTWKKRLDLDCGFDFNAVLCNYYRHGNDAMGWHSDNEPEMDQQCIASVSLGATRAFHFKHKYNGDKLKLELSHGSLLVMENMQENWLHALPRRMKVHEPRINFTFRRIVRP